MENKRVVSIDIARTICIVLIVTAHYQPDYSPSWYMVIIDVFHASLIQLFMFISGYVHWMTRKPVTYRYFIWKKFQRLMIPYFFVSVIVIIIKLFAERGLSVESPVNLSAFYKMLYYPVAGEFLWFLLALFLMNLIIPLFNTTKRLSVLLLLSLILYFLPVPFTRIFCLAQFKMYLMYFVLGCVVVEWENIRQFLDKIHFLIALGIFAGLFVLEQFIEGIIITELLTVCIPFAGIVFILNFSKLIELKTPTIKNILFSGSAYTYTIYLFHTTFEGFAKAILLKLPNSLTETNNQFVFICFGLLVILPGIIGPIILQKIIVRKSRILSYLIGEKYVGA